MKGQLFRISWNSIRLKLVLSVLLITFPMIAFLIYNNLYAITVVRHQVAESNRNLISLYMDQIDDNLNDLDAYMTNLIVNDKDLQMMSYMNRNQRVLAKVRLDAKMTADIGTLKTVDSIFVYTIADQDYFDVFRGFDNNTQERRNVRAYIRSLIRELEVTKEFNKRSWYVKRIGETYYFFRILQTSDAYVGAWVNIERLSVPLNLLELGERGFSLFATENGVPMTHEETVADFGIDLNHDLSSYYLSGTQVKHLVVGERSSKGEFSLIALIPDDQILGNLPYLRRIVTIISIGAVILVPLCLLLLRKMVLRPLNRIMAAMRRIGDGNLNARIEPFPTSDEFRMVNHTFNGMMEQIQELRIHVYEEQLNKQKAELQHLQLQINPHFFMNSLNIIYNLALVKNYALIQEMAISLVQYFRYMFRSNLTFLPLKDELQHIRNYIRIQELRFPDQLAFEISAPEFLLSARIPPLVIHTFVENSIKHAVSSEGPVAIAVRVDLDDNREAPMIVLVVRDWGSGFTEEVLREIRAGNRIVDAQGGEHIGIWNVRRRLGLLYGDLAHIQFTNAPEGGAEVRMRLPLHLGT